MDKCYVYEGPISSVTLPGGRDVMLHPGQSVALPAENPYVATLAARGHLTETPVSVKGAALHANAPGTETPARVKTPKSQAPKEETQDVR